MPVLELRNVSQSYEPGRPILQDLSLAVFEGEFVSVIGPSGAGKTTLLRLLNGMVRPLSGEIWILGQRFDRLQGKKRRRVQQQVGMIFQDFALTEESSCLQNVLNGGLFRVPLWRVLTGLFPAAETRQAQKALEQVGLAGYEDTLVRELSGGQKQRVAIARALLQRARILLCDEPVASLDPATARQILTLLRRLQQEKGLTILMNSHNVEQARQFSGRMIGLRAGRIVFAGPPEKWTEEKLHLLYGGAP